jgi:lipopolysaccharide transport system permease protein
MERGSRTGELVVVRNGPLVISASANEPIYRRIAELWEYRQLLWTLVERDLRVRYKQAVLGIGWAIIQPLLTMGVFAVVFGRLAGIRPGGNVPYPLFAYAGLLPWQLFAYGLAQASNSLVAEQRLITKVYFPRLIVPVAPVLAASVDLAFGFLVMLAMMLWYGVRPGWTLLVAPLFIVAAAATALGAGLWLSALNALYRDIRHTVPFLLQLWFFLSPVAYPSSLIPAQWRVWYELNPMQGAVEGFRWAMFGGGQGFSWLMLEQAGLIAALVSSGLYYFRRVERYVADVV